ncbi:MAG: hypothetical protein HN561_05295, partial [Candidatus Scalindua sp.]|nr:hypothetical protein [Candidatus Scalindua sp.]
MLSLPDKCLLNWKAVFIAVVLLFVLQGTSVAFSITDVGSAGTSGTNGINGNPGTNGTNGGVGGNATASAV